MKPVYHIHRSPSHIQVTETFWQSCETTVAYVMWCEHQSQPQKLLQETTAFQTRLEVCLFFFLFFLFLQTVVVPLVLLVLFLALAFSFWEEWPLTSYTADRGELDGGRELLTKKKSASSGLRDTRWRMRKHNWPTDKRKRNRGRVRLKLETRQLDN